MVRPDPYPALSCWLSQPTPSILDDQALQLWEARVPPYPVSGPDLRDMGQLSKLLSQSYQKRTMGFSPCC